MDQPAISSVRPSRGRRNHPYPLPERQDNYDDKKTWVIKMNEWGKQNPQHFGNRGLNYYETKNYFRFLEVLEKGLQSLVSLLQTPDLRNEYMDPYEARFLDYKPSMESAKNSLTYSFEEGYAQVDAWMKEEGTGQELAIEMIRLKVAKMEEYLVAPQGLGFYDPVHDGRVPQPREGVARIWDIFIFARNFFDKEGRPLSELLKKRKETFALGRDAEKRILTLAKELDAERKDDSTYRPRNRDINACIICNKMTLKKDVESGLSFCNKSCQRIHYGRRD